MTKIENLLIKLINIPSVTGDEAGITSFIASELSGLPVERQHVKGVRENIIVRKGSSKKWLVCHVDTVPGKAYAVITDDKIFGRGACDNKQSVAASIILAHELDHINVLFTVGEEKYFDGAQTAQKSGICDNAELVIVQEPTSFEIITGQCGVIAFTIETTGREQHSSLGVTENAIHKLSVIINNIISKGWNACNIGLISGGVAENVVAGQAVAVVSVRPRDDYERQSILDTLNKIPANVVINKDIASCSNNAVYPKKIVNHFSEMAFFNNSIQFGAGSILHAHTDEEHVTRNDLNILPSKLKELLS